MIHSVLTWIALAVAAVLTVQGSVSPVSAKVVQKGDKAPVFSLRSVEGQNMDLAYLIGSQVIVLGLFHICEPCMNQAMELESLADTDVGRKVLIVGVNTAGDSETAVVNYLSKFPRKIRFSYLLDPDRKVEDLFGVKATPVVYIIDRTGIVRFKGSSVSANTLRQELAKVLE